MMKRLAGTVDWDNSSPNKDILLQHSVQRCLLSKVECQVATCRVSRNRLLTTGLVACALASPSWRVFKRDNFNCCVRCNGTETTVAVVFVALQPASCMKTLMAGSRFVLCILTVSSKRSARSL